MKVIIDRDATGNYYFRLVAKNHKIISGGESYTRSHQAVVGFKRCVKRIREGKAEFYIDRAKEHRWRLIGRNGQNILEPKEGFKSLSGVKRSFATVADALSRGKAVTLVRKYDNAKYPEPEMLRL